VTRVIAGAPGAAYSGVDTVDKDQPKTKGKIMFRRNSEKPSRATLAAFSAMGCLWLFGIATLAVVPY
jgi:hypothetical protein